MRLLLVEDSERLRASLCEGLTRAGFAVDAVGEGRRGLAFAKRGLYDVLILDLMLPDISGLDVLRELRARPSDIHVLILTAKHAVEDRVLGLELGADDYLQKPFAFEELQARIHALVRRRYRSKSPRLEIGDLVVDTVGRRVTKNGVEIQLTRREFQILEYLARRTDQTVTRIEIEDSVYSERNLPESNAVESALSNLRRKLRGAGGSNPDPIQTRPGLGYCLRARSA